MLQRTKFAELLRCRDYNATGNHRHKADIQIPTNSTIIKLGREEISLIICVRNC